MAIKDEFQELTVKFLHNVFTKESVKIKENIIENAKNELEKELKILIGKMALYISKQASIRTYAEEIIVTLRFDKDYKFKPNEE